MKALKAISAHIYTCTSGWGTPPFPSREELRERFVDPERGELPLRAHLYRTPRSNGSARGLLVLVHGLSSQPDSPYLAPFVAQGLAEGWDVASLALRGSIGEGVDHYHGGLTGDLHALLASAPCASYADVRVIGCSLGGHITLRYACESPDPRVSAVAAICPPLDLSVTQRQLDRPLNRVYRAHLLSDLKRAYHVIWENATREGRPLPSKLSEVRSCRSIYDWDRLVVVPRFGFASVEAYHREMSLTLDSFQKINVPCLMVFARHDPIISLPQLSSLLPLQSLGGPVEVKVLERGGHLSFPRVVDLGVGLEASSLAGQVWGRMGLFKDAPF